MKATRQFSLALATAVMLSLFAAQWVSAQTETDTRLKIVGQVEAITDGSLLVNGRVISVANATVDTEIAVGASVMIDGYLTADNQVEATTVTSADANILLPDELRITGVLQTASDNSFNLGGSLVNSPDADLNASLDAGAVVRVFADAEGADWTARRVQVLNPGSVDLSADANLSADFDLLSQGSYQIVGTLDSIAQNQLVISGVPINVANASIQSPLLTGALVNVWLTNTFEGFSASQVSNATLDNDVTADAFVDVDASADSSTDANASADANADVSGSTDANADTNADVNADNNGAGVNIDLGGGVDINLGGG
jgi:hypothetical protein